MIELKNTDSEVASDDNKFIVKDNIGTLNEKTDIFSSLPLMEFIDGNGIGVNYDNDDSDDIENDCNENNVNKPLLNDYNLS